MFASKSSLFQDYKIMFASKSSLFQDYNQNFLVILFQDYSQNFLEVEEGQKLVCYLLTNLAKA